MFKFVKSEEVLSCEGCKCILKNEDAYKVLYCGFFQANFYYCNRCKPNYDKVVYQYDFPSSGRMKTVKRYYVTREIEVDENGKEVKKK